MFYSNSCIESWRHGLINLQFTEDMQKAAASLRRFRRISPLIEDIMFEADPEHPWLQLQQVAQDLPAWICSLSPTVLTGLAVRHLPLTAAAVDTIAQFGQLRQLFIVQDGPAAYGDGLAAVVDQLKRLEAFQLEASSVEQVLVAALCRLPRLADVDLEAKGKPLPNLEGLTALAGSLTSLILQERESKAGGLEFPAVASLPKLGWLFVAAPKVQVSGCCLPLVQSSRM